MKIFCKLALVAVLLLPGISMAQSVLLAHASGGPSDLAAAMASEFTTVDVFEVDSGTPTLEELAAYNAVVVWTNATPADGVALGDNLADYVDAGGCVVIGTYGLSTPWTVSGRMQTTGYSPLVDVGSNGTPSGNLVALQPADVVFTGVDVGTQTYFNNSNFAIPGLDSGATLLADDGNGVNMIARNAAGNVLAYNLYPVTGSGNSAGIYTMFVNGAADCQGDAVVFSTELPVPVNHPLALLAQILLLGLVGLFVARRFV